eukprot:TRINITY_DN3789_c0_g1_i4.p1 TRINITY_DN3789_c0_g1~~TRINITY_DN3789_c0_g1_i4.p1  ORF type:complete len:240 (+),score=69.24 TRINITY_DN3789_c0_g1_i4:179-898(+)
MRDALNATGRPVFFSLCGWNDWYAPEGASLANSWRTGPDDSNWPGVLANVDIMAEGSSKLGDLAAFAGPHKGWNDPCLLLSQDSRGTRAVSELQTRTQFSLWAVLAAPLLISGSITNMTQADYQTYTNKEVIAVSQDPLGMQGSRVTGTKPLAQGATAVFARKLADGAVVLLAVNTMSTPTSVVCDSTCFTAFGWGAAQLPAIGTDLWAQRAINVTALEIRFDALPGNGGSQMFRLASK